MRSLLPLLAVLLAPITFAAEPASAPLDDGPYLRRAGHGLDAEWICDGQVQRAHVAFRQGRATVPARCGYPHALEIDAAAAPPVRAQRPMPARLAALSDIHGQYAVLRRLLRAQGLIDAQDRWAWGDGLLVVGGDVFDRGPQVTESFWLLQQLQRQARAAGGDVLFLLGNHETMTLYDDLRYLNPKYAQVAGLLGRPYPALYGGDSVLGTWLRQAPAMARVGDTLFLHGGVSPEFLAQGIDRDEANLRYQQSLGTPKAEVKADPRTAPLYDGKTSPIWYRGYFDGRATTDTVAAALRTLGVARIVVGHTSMAHVGSYFDGRVIAIDSSIKRGESGEMLLIEDGVLSRGLLDGSRATVLPGDGEDEDD
ncbi:metallophosphoesterase [Stenotrophomonas sp. HITSZ_GD]|uniref:metallophosphoesterase n=1 Tax=Stenotrophomonas sp. HITSZ_GD TaxID=3037248 RepID=UPI00240D7EDE|nr:metallophosphoesterase [Stenotrophomonas sp. HITSZ_GD]MDG2525836.1 metallophosphoesterase [Stenotrophomonas sp. HITSZ_GD]